MPTTLVLTFPLGRYHATPWGRHVNEGAVEVPPSPWRLLRTLYAVWRTRAPDLPKDTVHELLATLAAPPTFHVPRHAPGHTRHYYPDTAIDTKSGRSGKDRTLDAFVVFEHDADLAARWPVDLPPDQRAALERIAGSIPYFGRADSVCTGTVPATWTPDAHETWQPLDVADHVDPHVDVTAVLAPTLPLDLPALLVTPTQVRKAGLPLPRGAHLVGYQKSTDLPVPTRRAAVPTGPAPTAVRFTLLQAGLPPETDALVYTDLLRQAALSGRDPRAGGTVLGGRTASGDKADGQHTHAHYLPLTEGRRLTGLVAWAPAGFQPDELKQLTGLRALYSKQNDAWRTTIRLAGVGDITDTAPELGTGPHLIWRSATPFTPARFPKRHIDWVEHLSAEVRRELAYRGVATPCEVTAIPGNWTAFRRYRPSARQRHDARQGSAQQPSALLRLTFAEPVAGPIAIGHLAHFGLGLFVPDHHGSPRHGH